MKRAVAITGLGAVTPLGNDVEATWRSLVAGQSGVGRLDTFDTTASPIEIAAEVRGFDLGAYLESRRLKRLLSRAGGFLIGAAAQALRDAGVGMDDYSSYERGIAMGANPGRLPATELAEILHLMEVSNGHQLYRQAPMDVVGRTQNAPVAVLAQLHDLCGPCITVNTACAASAHSIGEAMRRIQEGDARLMVAGGYDALTTYLDVLGFALLGALTQDHQDEPARASRPFDRGRSGFVIGEGAVVVVLEDLESARARGARVYAELSGYASSLNAYRITDSPPDGSGAIQAMAGALRDAARDPEQVQCVVAHGTSTPGNDLSETRALKAVFGNHAYRLAITAPKSMSGHLTAAAGGLNLLVAALGIRDGVVPPTINLEEPDPELDLDYVPNRARPLELDNVLCNAFAFGGTNASMLVSRHPADVA